MRQNKKIEQQTGRSICFNNQYLYNHPTKTNKLNKTTEALTGLVWAKFEEPVAVMGLEISIAALLVVFAIFLAEKDIEPRNVEFWITNDKPIKYIKLHHLFVWPFITLFFAFYLTFIGAFYKSAIVDTFVLVLIGISVGFLSLLAPQVYTSNKEMNFKKLADRNIASLSS